MIGVPKEKQIHLNGLVYGGQISAYDSVRYIINANCVLELKVQDVESYSDRVQKAITYNKKILTNNFNVSEIEFFTPDMIHIYQNVGEIDFEFVKESIYKHEYLYRNEFNPIHFLKKIEKEI